MKHKNEAEVIKISQDLLFKRPYIWILTISITSLNFLITYNFQSIDLQLLYYYFADIITTYMIIEFYALGIRFLNRKAPLHSDFVKRVLYQLTLHTLSVIVFTILLNELFDFLFFKGERLSLSFVFYTKDTFVALLFILLFHAVYFALFLMSNKQNLESLKMVPDPRIKVKDAIGYKLLDKNQILVIYSLLGITYIIDSDDKKFTSELTLKEMDRKLGEDFFRANRRVILSRDIIDSYKNASYGKISITLNKNELMDLSKTVVVSRDKASQFRTWISSVPL